MKKSKPASQIRQCAYCGCELKKGPNQTTDHVFPKCTYPLSLASSKIQRITVKACLDCNKSFQDDETHFRNILPLCGLEPAPIVKELFNGHVRPSFEECDGERRLEDILKIMGPDTDGRTRIWAEEDERFLRILRKIVRGLCRHYDLGWPVADEKVHIERLKYHVPPQLLEEAPGGRIDDLYRWAYGLNPDDDTYASWWLLILRSDMRFVGRVAR